MDTKNLGNDDFTRKGAMQHLLQLSLVASSNDNGVVFNTADGKIFWVNDSFCRLTGYPYDEIIGKMTLDFCRGPLTDDSVLTGIAKSIGKKSSFTEELIHYRKDGTWFWGRVNGKLFKSGKNQEARCFAIVEDITLEKQKEEKLEVLSKIAEDNLNPVILTDEKGLITWVNKSFTKVTGYTFKEALNKKPGHLLQGPDTDPNTIAYLKKQIANGLHFNTEILNYSKSGKAYWLRIQGQPIRNSNGGLMGFFAVEENITSEKNASELIKESEARFRLVLEKIGDNVWEHNLQTGKTIFSKTSSDPGFVLHKISGSEMFWWDVHTSDELKLLKTTYLNYQTGLIDSHSMEYRVVNSDGTTKWILDRGAVIEYDLKGKPLRISGTHTDISKIKQTETELEQRAKQFKSLSENIPGVIYEYEFRPDGTEGLRYISPAIERIFGIKAEDFKDYLKYVQPEDRERIIKKNKHSRDTLEPFYDESLLTIPGGGSKWQGVHSSFSYIAQNGAKVFTGFIQDITERKNIEETLRINEAKYRNIIANMNLGLVEVDIDELITFANNTFCEMSGYTLNELLGKNASLLLTEGDNEDIFKEKKKLRKTGIADAYETKLVNKKGEEKWWLISGAPRYNDKGKLAGSIGIYLDISDQKKQETELIEARKGAENLAHTQEIFLANMSHEIRTPMNAIMGMSNQLSKTNLAAEQRFFLDVIHSASENLLVIINDILDLSKIEAGKLNIENIGFEPKESAKRVIQVLAHKAEEKGLTLRNSYFDTNISPVLIGDPYRLNQVLLNLISNAIKFTEMGVIDLTFKLLNDSHTSQLIQIEVVDTGVGMDESYLTHLFDKFSQESGSVSRRYGGSGLGMSICKDLVELMNGEIYAESKKNEGTRVTSILKLKKGRYEDLVEKVKVQFRPDFLKDKQILVTDDNELNRLVASIILQNYGANVTESANGSNSIELIKKRSFDVVLMDIQMPGINGFDATRIIRKTGYNYPIVALTAQAIKGEREKCLAAGMDDYITKPINEEEFLSMLDKWTKHPNPSTQLIDEIMGEQQLYDLSSLKAISRGNETFMQKMVNIFCEQTPIMLKEMEAASLVNDLDKISKTAHQMKPSIDNLNIVSLKQLVRDIENAVSEDADNTTLQQKLDTLKSTLLNVIDKLKIEYPA
ncbi:PAS domain S-box-containing protein [Mucilaginibacter frigoritolerans]|uniref:Sensory/regulatory protein RpfC n=1 Tax=Mucilaginibacter frigoritolerans TaxID=652788 RepID=A0A562TQS5_9SPHI|nr:PAS domain S-box protein [Mucilaginibacter frigoritolerans]TWI95544.1 PAS domain S-box-containing protein [Mucilaginibacter frigoritolerans]